MDSKPAPITLECMIPGDLMHYMIPTQIREISKLWFFPYFGGGRAIEKVKMYSFIG